MFKKMNQGASESETGHPKARKIKSSIICKGHIGRVNVCRFLEKQSSETAYFLSGGEDDTVKLWNCNRGDEPLLVHSFKGGHTAGDILDVAAGAGALRLASVGVSKAVCLWDVTSGAQWGRLHGHESQINTCFFKDATFLATGSNDGTIRLWDTRAKSCIQILPRFGDAVTGVFVDDNSVVGSSLDGTLRDFDVRTGNVQIDEIAFRLGSMCVSRDKNLILASCVSESEPALRLVERKSGKTVRTITGHKNSQVSLRCCFDHQDSSVGCGSEDGIVRFWDTTSGNVLVQLDVKQPVMSVSHHNVVGCFALSGTNGLLRFVTYE